MPDMMSLRSCPSGFVPYIIRIGDTLALIARQYNTTFQNIIYANPGIIPSNLIVGQQICIPLTPQLYPSCPTKNYYVVVPRDTIESIAQYFNVTYDQLLYANYGIKDLYIDQVLCIPMAPSPVCIEINMKNRNLVVYRGGSVYKTYSFVLERPNFPIANGNITVLYKDVDPELGAGARWIGLSIPGLGIRGTNSPIFIERASTGNDIILSNDNANELFNLVPVGTVVKIS